MVCIDRAILGVRIRVIDTRVIEVLVRAAPKHRLSIGLLMATLKDILRLINCDDLMFKMISLPPKKKVGSRQTSYFGNLGHLLFLV